MVWKKKQRFWEGINEKATVEGLVGPEEFNEEWHFMF